ncbi:MAG: hypothetical protein CL600_09815 [Alteromonas sp.]|nr:hypothetical protein [Alteromonas sp.]
MSSVTYPCDMNVKDVLKAIRRDAKSRVDFQMTDSTFKDNVLWLGGMRTTDNARFYDVERYQLASYEGQVTVRSECLAMGFNDSRIPANIFKKLRAECYWRNTESIMDYIRDVSDKRTRLSAKRKQLNALGVNDGIIYNNREYQLVENIGSQGWRVRDVENGKTYKMSQYRFHQSTPLTAVRA